MDTESPPAVPRPAASVLLLRDSPNGIEVFMATRHEGSSFMPGVLVFPGGSVEPEDADLIPANAPEDAISRIAGIREAFEEAGFLLARQQGQDRLLPADRFGDLLHRYRAPFAAGEGSFSQMLEIEGLVPATDLMVPFARWITPVIRKKRFDARFFLARAPEGQIGAHDEQELINSRWIGAAEALEAVKRGEVKIVFVTRSNLGLLAKSRTVDEALAAARARTIVPVEPQLFDHPDGPALRIPAEAGYDITEILVRDVGD